MFNNKLVNFVNFVFDLIKIVVISLVIIIPIRHFLIQPFYVKGASMEPNFHDSEYLIVDELSYRLKDIQRGDIVVFRYPKDPSEYFIKRVIGLPGEKVQVKNGSVYIFNKENPRGVILDEPYLAADVKTLSSGEEVYDLNNDEIFVLGDNRNFSNDSRIFGPVGKTFIIGKVFLRGWPFNRATIFKSQVYNLNIQ